MLLKILSLQYPSIHPSSQIVQQEVALEKISELLDFSFFRNLEYKYSQYAMLLAKLLLCMQNQNFGYYILWSCINHICTKNVYE